MSNGTTSGADVIRLRQNIQDLLRRRVLEAVGTVFKKDSVRRSASAASSVRRSVYRNGHETRRITTALGTEDLDVPRGRIVEDGGSTREFSQRDRSSLPTADARGRRSDPRCVSGGREYAAHPQGA